MAILDHQHRARVVNVLRLLNEAITLLHLEVTEEVTKADDLEFLERRLEEIDFGKGHTTRILNAAKNHVTYVGDGTWIPTPLVTVRDLISVSDAELIREPNVGRKTVNMVKAVLKEHGLKLKDYYA